VAYGRDLRRARRRETPRRARIGRAAASARMPRFGSSAERAWATEFLGYARKSEGSVMARCARRGRHPLGQGSGTVANPHDDRHVFTVKWRSGGVGIARNAFLRIHGYAQIAVVFIIRRGVVEWRDLPWAARLAGGEAWTSFCSGASFGDACCPRPARDAGWIHVATAADF